MIEDSIAGLVSKIAPAVDQSTGKIEVKIQASDPSLQNGDTVTLTIKQKTSNKTIAGPLYVPISAVRFSSENGSVFMVEEDVLVSKSVVIGKISGNLVEILEGIDVDTEIVIDARGLAAGGKVEAVK